MSDIVYRRVDPDAKAPYRAYPDSAGWDLHAMQEHLLHPMIPVTVGTGLAFEIPRNCFAAIWGRSGLGQKGVSVLGGLIDSDYRGEVKVILINLSAKTHQILPGDRVAQLVPFSRDEVYMAESDRPLGETQRGAGGFGSTGL